MGSISSFLHSVQFPLNSGCWKNAGMSLLSTLIRSLGMMSDVKSNQNLLIWVRTSPF